LAHLYGVDALPETTRSTNFFPDTSTPVALGYHSGHAAVRAGQGSCKMVVDGCWSGPWRRWRGAA